LIGYQVRGDSMAGGKRPIHDGDTIIVNKNDKGHSGDVVVARLTDDSMVCKAMKVDKFGWRLMSLNSMYTNSAPPIIAREDVAEIIGCVVRVSSNMEKLED
jgi:repressor LexA